MDWLWLVLLCAPSYCMYCGSAYVFVGARSLVRYGVRQATERTTCSSVLAVRREMSTLNC